MKAIIYILAALSLVGCKEPKIDPIIQFIYDNHGMKVGHGNCKELVVEAMSLKYENFYEDYFLNDDTLVSRNIRDMAKVGPGDLIMLTDTIYNYSHIGIITDVYGDTMIYASQNIQQSYSDQEIEIFLYGKRDNAFSESKVQYDMVVLGDTSNHLVFLFDF